MISGYSNNSYPNPSYQAPSVQPAASNASSMSSGSPAQSPSATTVKVASVLTSIWNGLVNVVKSFFSWIGSLFSGNSGSSTSTTTGSALTPQQAAIAQQYQLLPTAANVTAFVNEVQSYQNDGALGPGSSNTTAITDLQTALDKLGYTLPITGQYDSATQQAIIQFKQANGLHQSYEAANNTWAINEYADPQTLQLIMGKLQQQVASTPTSSSVGTTYPSSSTPSSTSTSSSTVTAPTIPTSTSTSTATPSQPTVNYDAIAKQYGLLDTPANVSAFINEIKGYQTGNALGPGSTQTSAIRDLQTALSRLGYSVQVNGQYNSATSQAVMAFKRASGLHQTYEASDGNWAVNEYADPQTLSLLMQKLQQQAAAQPTSAPAATTSPSSASMVPASVSTPASTAALSAPQAALARQYNLYPTAANIQAFTSEVGSYATDGTLGPGSTQTSAIRDLQTALSRFGYPVQVTGTYDPATANAVIAFKKSDGLHQSYRAADGNWAVNEYADRNTLLAIMQKLQAAAGKVG